MHSKPCLFTEEKIISKIQEAYPTMDILEVNYHASHVLDNDWLKVTNDEDELEITITEQVEDLLNK